MLDPEIIGQRRLQELALRDRYPIMFDARELGWYSINRRPVLVALCGKEWTLLPCTPENVRAYRGRGAYIVRGRKVEHLVNRTYGVPMSEAMDRFESEDTSRPLKYATTREIVSAAMGARSSKKAKNTYSREEAGTIRQVVTVKRFRNSRLTCVCKSRMYN